MIIGNGMLAKAFSSYMDQDDFIIFASGVPNASETREEMFARERDLLLSTIAYYPDKTLVYFGTCSFYDSSAKNLYIEHKKKQEAIIFEKMKKYMIFRLANAIGKTTNVTFLSQMCKNIKNHTPFEVWMHSTRNILDCDDLFKIADRILSNGLYHNQIINLASPQKLFVEDIVKMLEKISGKTAQYTLVPKGAAFDIDVSLIESIAQQLGIVFDENYTMNTLKKYYLNYFLQDTQSDIDTKRHLHSALELTT